MTANEYAALGLQAANMAQQLTPDPNSPCERDQEQNLIVYHLRTAASRLRGLAEFTAERERVKGVDQGGVS